MTITAAGTVLAIPMRILVLVIKAGKASIVTRQIALGRLPATTAEPATRCFSTPPPASTVLQAGLGLIATRFVSWVWKRRSTAVTACAYLGGMGRDVT